jgi:hypothetical protein
MTREAKPLLKTNFRSRKKTLKKIAKENLLLKKILAKKEREL